MLESLCAWLEKTPLSTGIQNVGWIIPAGQVVHILGLAAILFSALSIDLRVLGIGGRRTPSPELRTTSCRGSGARWH
jgi:hypothetical protein